MIILPREDSMDLLIAAFACVKDNFNSLQYSYVRPIQSPLLFIPVYTSTYA
jgi:hypothetical protein